MKEMILIIQIKLNKFCRNFVKVLSLRFGDQQQIHTRLVWKLVDVGIINNAKF